MRWTLPALLSKLPPICHPMTLCLHRLPPRLQPILPVFSSLLLMFTTGFSGTLGNYAPYIMAHMRQANVTVAEQHLLFIAILQGGPPFSHLIGGFMDKFAGPRFAGAIGSAFLSGGLVMSHFTIDVSFVCLLLTLGLSFGLGSGIIVGSAYSVTLKWLPNHRGIASGMAMAGTGLAALVFSPLQAAYINFPADTNHTFEVPKDVFARIPKMFLYFGIALGSMQCFALLFLSLPKPKASQKTAIKLEKSNAPSEEEVPLKAMLCSTTFYWLVMTCLGASLVSVVKVYYKLFGELFIESDNFLSIVSSIAMCCAVGFRFVSGIIVNKFGYQVVMCIISAILTVAMVTFQFTYHMGAGGYAVWVALIVCSGGCVSVMFPYATAVFFGSKNVGVNLSFIFLAPFFSGIIVACGTLGMGDTLTRNSYNILWYMAAGGWLAVFILTATIHKTTYGAKLHNKQVREKLNIYDIENEYLGAVSPETIVLQRRHSALSRVSLSRVALDELKGGAHPTRKVSFVPDPITRFSSPPKVEMEVKSQSNQI